MILVPSYLSPFVPFSLSSFSPASLPPSLSLPHSLTHSLTHALTHSRRQSTASLLAVSSAQVILPGHLHHVQATRWLLNGTSTFAKFRGQSTRSPTRSPGGGVDLCDGAKGRRGRAQGWGPVVFDRMYAINRSIPIRDLGAETAGNIFLIVAARINIRICT